MAALKSQFYIGDIHGRADLLHNMLVGIDAHSQRNYRKPEVVFLGDLTDRGPSSREVLDLVQSTLEQWEGSTLILGNHDEWFLETIKYGDDYIDAESWILNGGLQTIMSYCDGDIPHDAMEFIMTKYPQHMEMLSNAVRIHENGKFIGAHAGIDPTRSIENQRNGDLNWIREPFLSFVEREMRPVIHGHTIIGTTPVVTENRISIDTGAYESDLLSACLVDAENKSINFFQASPHGFEEVKPVLLDRGCGTIYDRIDDLFNAES